MRALRQAFEALLSLRMILLVIVPPLLAVLLVSVLFFVSWQGWTAGLAEFLGSFGPLNWLERATGFHEIAAILAGIFLVLFFIPMAYLSAVVFTSLFVMPVALKWISESDFKGLEKKRGGSFWGSLWNTVLATILFIIVFFITLPFWLLPGFQMLVPLLLTAWLNKKIFMYDVLQDFASVDERRQIESEESHQLYALGLILALLSYLPLAVFIVPVVSAMSFIYYGLNELQSRRNKLKTR